MPGVASRMRCGLISPSLCALSRKVRGSVGWIVAGGAEHAAGITKEEDMYYLSSSLSDRINYDESVRIYAYETMRAAEVPVWQINPDKLARYCIKLGGLPKSDDPAEARARYIDAFRRTHAEMLRDAIDEAIDEYNIGDIDEHIQPVRLLWMPNANSLEALGDAAGHFGDNGDNPDGDAWLAPANVFTQDELAAAERAGGKVIDGYEFDYPCGVVIDRRMSHIFEPGAVALRGWCGYQIHNVGYALDRNVATAVCAASIALAKEEEED